MQIELDPVLYSHGLRTLQIYHTQLRLEWNSLNFHKKNIIESPLCRCGDVETTKHYFLNCPHYHVPRNQLLNDYLHLPIKTLLKGDTHLILDENETIFNAVQTFIAHTGRLTYSENANGLSKQVVKYIPYRGISLSNPYRNHHLHSQLIW